jgi:hypothetical protein
LHAVQRRLAGALDQAVCVACQCLGLCQRGVGIAAGQCQLFQQLADLVTLFGHRAGHLIQMGQGIVDVPDIIVRQQLAGFGHHLVDIEHQVFAAAEQFGQRRGVGDDHTRFAIVSVQ